jgi:hypothetical protein
LRVDHDLARCHRPIVEKLKPISSSQPCISLLASKARVPVCSGMEAMLTFDAPLRHGGPEVLVGLGCDVPLLAHT